MSVEWLSGACVLLVPGLVWAATPQVERFEPVAELELLGLQGIDQDTGWQPPGSNIQVRFLTHADDEVLVEMPGDAVLDWDTGEVYFAGDEDGGVFDVDIGVSLEGRFRFDLLGQQFESSLIGPYAFGIFREATFTPYLLPGNEHRPVQIDDETTPVEVFNYAIVDLLVASGNFFVDASFDIDMALACERIDVTDASVLQGSIAAEFDALVVADPGEELVERLARLHCTLLSDVDLLLYPGVELQIGFQEFQLAPFELRIPLLQGRTGALEFEPLPIVFDEPPEDSPVGSTGQAGASSGDGSGGSSTSDGSSSESGRPAGDGSSGTTGDVDDFAETDTDGAAAAAGQGCGCTSGSGGNVVALWTLLGLGLGLGRRRRATGPRG